MAPTIIVHVGDQGTFERELQHALLNGICHAEGVTFRYARRGLGSGEDHLQFFRSVYAPNMLYEDFLQQIRDEFLKSNADFFVISCSYLASLRPESLRDVLRLTFPDAQWKIIKYIRSHAEYTIGRFQKKLMQMRTSARMETIADFARQYRPLYTQAETAGFWRDTFKDDLVLVPFDHESPEAMITDFLHRVTTVPTDKIRLIELPKSMQQRMSVDEIRLYEQAIEQISPELFTKDDHTNTDLSLVTEDTPQKPMLHSTELDRMMQHFVPALLQEYGQSSEDYTLSRNDILGLREFCLADAEQLDAICDTSFFTAQLAAENAPETPSRSLSVPEEINALFGGAVKASQVYLLEHLKNTLP